MVAMGCSGVHAGRDSGKVCHVRPVPEGDRSPGYWREAPLTACIAFRKHGAAQFPPCADGDHAAYAKQLDWHRPIPEGWGIGANKYLLAMSVWRFLAASIE